MRKLTLLLAAGLFLLNACSKDSNGADESLRATFDKTDYYPFDVVTVQLSKAATAAEYTGTIGTTAVKVQRFADSVLVAALPDLPAGEYTLSLQMERSKVEGKLKIIPLPAVANPDVVIAEVVASLVELTAEVEDPSYASAIAQLMDVFNNEVLKMNAAERKQFASILAAHPEWYDYAAYKYEDDDGDSFPSRISGIGRANLFLRHAMRFTANCAGIITMGDTFLKSVFALSASPLLGAAGMALSGIVGLYFLSEAVKYADIVERDAFKIKELIFDGSTRASADYTLNNGGTLAFNVSASFRSITAEDAADGAGGVSLVITAANTLRSVWDKVASGLETAREYVSDIFLPSMPGERPKKISEITTPLNVETDVVDNWTLQIVSGNVTAQKTGADTYKFTTTATKDVEFTFKITAEGTDSRVFSGLLKVGGTNNLAVGKWRRIKTFVDEKTEYTLTFYASASVELDITIISIASSNSGEIIDRKKFYGTYCPVYETYEDACLNLTYTDISYTDPTQERLKAYQLSGNTMWVYYKDSYSADVYYRQ